MGEFAAVTAVQQSAVAVARGGGAAPDDSLASRQPRLPTLAFPSRQPLRDLPPPL